MASFRACTTFPINRRKRTCTPIMATASVLCQLAQIVTGTHTDRKFSITCCITITFGNCLVQVPAHKILELLKSPCWFTICAGKNLSIKSFIPDELIIIIDVLRYTMSTPCLIDGTHNR